MTLSHCNFLCNMDYILHLELICKFSLDQSAIGQNNLIVANTNDYSPNFANNIHNRGIYEMCNFFMNYIDIQGNCICLVKKYKIKIKFEFFWLILKGLNLCGF